MPARRQAIPAIQDNQMAAGYFFLGAHHVFLRPQALWDCPDHIPEYANARRPYRLLMPIDRAGPRDLPQMVPWESEHAAPTCFHAPLAPGTSSRYGSPLKDHFIVADWTRHRERTHRCCPHVAEVLSAATAIVSTLRSGNVVVEHHSYAGLEGLGNLGGHLLGEFGEFFGLRDHRIELLARMCGRQCNELQR